MKFLQHAFKAMGTLCEIQLFANTHRLARRAAEAAIADVNRLESLYSRYRCDSFLSAINRVASDGGGIRVDEETTGLLNYAAAVIEQRIVAI